MEEDESYVDKRDTWAKLACNQRRLVFTEQLVLNDVRKINTLRIRDINHQVYSTSVKLQHLLLTNNANFSASSLVNLSLFGRSAPTNGGCV